MKHHFEAQSYRWPSFDVVTPDDHVGPLVGMRLQERKAGNLTEYTLLPGGEWQAVPVDFSGEIATSNVSTGETIRAVASSGSWSGGSNYKGFVFGKPGGCLCFKVKGYKKWLLFTPDGPVWHTVKPGTEPVER